MSTIFPREEKAEQIFDKILENPEACERLKDTFFEAIPSAEESEGAGTDGEDDKDIWDDSLFYSAEAFRFCKILRQKLSLDRKQLVQCTEHFSQQRYPL